MAGLAFRIACYPEALDATKPDRFPEKGGFAQNSVGRPAGPGAFQSLHRSTEARLGITDHACGGAEPAMLDNPAKTTPDPASIRPISHW